MSLEFNNVANGTGIIQRIEKEIGVKPGYISGSTQRMKEWTSDINMAHDELLDIGFKCGGTWQLDDTNLDDDYPFIFMDLTSGQRDYTFITDETGNLILNIHRVMVAQPSGEFKEIYPVDVQTRNNNNMNTDSLINGLNQGGIPTRYDKTGNGILLDYVPNYTVEDGLKVFIDREGSYFVYTDTNKKPGVPGLLHNWYVLKPAMEHARRKGLSCHDRLALEVLKMEARIKETFGKREKDIRRGMRANVESNK